MNKKGFTLIELLAVIVILAIIALITAPIILGVIENARKDAAKDKAWGTIKAVELAYTQDQVKDSTYKIGTPVTFNNKKASVGSVQVKASGELPESGTITIREDGSIIAQGLKFKEYICSTIKSETDWTIDPNNMECVKGEHKVVYRYTEDKLKIGDSIEGIETTTDYNSLGKNYFLKHEVVDNKITSSEACFITDMIHCFKPNEYEMNKEILKSQEQWFINHGGSCFNLPDGPEGFRCQGGGFMYLITYKNGAIDVAKQTNVRCMIIGGVSNCS